MHNICTYIYTLCSCMLVAAHSTAVYIHNMYTCTYMYTKWLHACIIYTELIHSKCITCNNLQLDAVLNYCTLPNLKEL